MKVVLKADVKGQGKKGEIPGLGRSHIPHALEQLSLCAPTPEPEL